ncbi:MAG: Gfo/Idh/MocA family oxidoreductase [Promicromonosporaceae bacterium]|nr:Gfo/Idh/MocA family oxidoreductase [Promicromonosporaceae bacterium]
MTLPATLPAPRTPDTQAAPPLNWGILGPGGIAGAFAWVARGYTRQRLVAVGSRDYGRAQQFAARYEIPTAHGSYEALVADPNVQAVYVATPHSHHYEHAKLALAAGKHVLIEKSFTTSAAQAQELVDLAAARGLALMEAMWTRFLPRTDTVRQLLENGALGELDTLIADHGQPLLHVPRLTDPHLAGGALLDLAIYPVSWAVFALGLPGRIQASGSLTDRGVDRQETIILDQFPNHPNARAVLHATMSAKTATSAVLSGTHGRVELDNNFYRPGPVRAVDNAGNVLIRHDDWQTSNQGMAGEIAEFAQIVADGRRESALLPLAETVAIMAIMDEVRVQLGVTYPWEQR